MLPRGRPRALVAAALLLVLILMGFFLFGGDLECERREQGDLGSFPCSLTPRVPPDGDLPADHGGRNRSDCVPLRPLPPKCEVGARGPWWQEPGGAAPPSWPPRHLRDSHLASSLLH